MYLVIVTDIFGVNKSIRELQQASAKEFERVTIVDPYSGLDKEFKSEADAYSFFNNNCGHDYFLQKLNDAIKTIKDKIILVGFSAGASAAWRAVNLKQNFNVNHLLAFYPGQIRNHLELQPICNVSIIFPNIETHFNVDDCIEILEKNTQIDCRKNAQLHGFMNPFSNNYSADEAAKFFYMITHPQRVLMV